MKASLRPAGCFALVAAAASLAMAAAADQPTVRAATPVRGDLGIRIEESPGRRGVRVAALEPAGPAAGAGVAVGDVIVALDGRAMGSGRDVRDYLDRLEPGSRVRVDIDRHGHGEHLYVVLDAAAAAHGSRRVTTSGLAPLAPLADLNEQPVEGFDGVRFVPMNAGLGRYFGADHGLLVVQAARGNPLQLEDGDVVQSIDGRVPEDVEHAFDLLSAAGPDGRLVLEVLRDRRARRVEITPAGSAPPAVRRRSLDPRSPPQSGRGD